MPPNRKPRRTHNLGGCTTCRRRHVKCDQKRPLCTVCLNAGIECEGFPSQIRWASMSIGPSAPKIVRVQQAAGKPQEHQHLISDSRDMTHGSQHRPSDSLQRPEISTPRLVVRPSTETEDHRSCNMSDDPPAEFTDSMPAVQVESVGMEPSIIATGSDDSNYPPSISLPDLDSLFDFGNSLGWDDLFNSAESDIAPIIQEHAYDDHLGRAPPTPSRAYHPTQNHRWYDCAFTPNGHRDPRTMGTVSAISDPASLPVPSDISEAEILEEAKYLLKLFRDVVIPQFHPLPTCTKSPWEVLNWSTAIQTHADMTFLATNNTKHATKANLFAILGCSAHSVMKTESSFDSIAFRRNSRILEYVSKAAKDHMQRSLKEETCGPQKAKYKDQLMAILSLTALASLRGNSNEARCHLIDAEYLLRRRGLAKREVSRRARILHHVYTWLRIIGESTFTLHDYECSALQAKIEIMVDKNREIRRPNPAPEQIRLESNGPIQLDDFLRVETHGTNDESDVDPSKEQIAGLQDIHLTKVQQWPKSLYMDIYGIPEFWLKLVSQTTRVANITDLLEQKSLRAPPTFISSLHKETNRLEPMICILSAQYRESRSSSPTENRNHLPTNQASTASKAMLRALGSALVILFYRRIRKVQPWILQTHVIDVRNSLTEFETAQSANAAIQSGSPWPAFIAGCEAMCFTTREWYKAWMQKGIARSASSSFAASLLVMQEVWDRRDAADHSTNVRAEEITGRKKEEVPSWVDVLQEGKTWLMLY